MRGDKILLRERELKEIVKKIIEGNSLVIKNIKFLPTECSLEVRGTIKKLFSLDGNILLKIKTFDERSITLEIKKVTSLKIDIFSKVKKVLEGTNISRFKDKGIMINGKKIIIDGYKLLESLNLGTGTLEDIEVLDDGLLMILSNISEDKLLALKKIG